MEVKDPVFLKDIWGVILKQTNLYDTIFIRASSKWLNKLCKEFRPFPKYHVLDQATCMAYLIELGSISCLDYVKNTLHFEWTSMQSLTAVRYGQVAVLKHLCANGCPFTENHALITCTTGTCSLDMIKYLHERGNTWRMDVPYDNFISDMATHGHLNCIKYAIQTGCTNKKVYYTPSMECLEFFVENQFEFKDQSRNVFGHQNFCEYAAACGNLPMLQYAHQNGTPLNSSALGAARSGQLECLKYVLENGKEKVYMPHLITNVECFDYLLEKFGKEEIGRRLSWQTVMKTNNVEFLKYIINSGISLPTRGSGLQMLMSAAVSSCEMMKIICNHIPLENQLQAWEEVSPHALCARCGDITGLKNLFELGVPISTKIKTETIIHNAILAGNVDVLKFVWEKIPNKEGFDIQNALDNSCQTTPEAIDFLVEHGAKLTTQHLCSALVREKLQIVAHLTRLGCQLNEVPDGIPDSLCFKYLREHSPTNSDN